ncbi:DUF2624 family protein [Bacillus piscicola]|uniref:DUF2624 family protein n=1 Tax=Bacillus piscicola TaxID=1632684 RepID=UPI001F09F3BC
MNPFKDQLIKYKISELHPNDLIQYGRLYGANVSFQEASALLEIVQHREWSTSDKQSMYALLREAKSNVSSKTYEVLEKLFQDYVGL